MANQKTSNAAPGSLSQTHLTGETISNRKIRSRVAQKAYELHEAGGKLPGQEVANWLEAARIIMTELGGRGPQDRPLHSLIVSFEPRKFDVKLFFRKED